jgi:hypothetical protein
MDIMGLILSLVGLPPFIYGALYLPKYREERSLTLFQKSNDEKSMLSFIRTMIRLIGERQATQAQLHIEGVLRLFMSQKNKDEISLIKRLAETMGEDRSGMFMADTADLDYEIDWFNFLMIILDEVEKKLPRSVLIKLHIAYIGYHKIGNRWKSIYSLLGAQRLSPSIQQEASILRLMKNIESDMIDQDKNSKTNGKVDILKFYEFQKKFSEFQVSILSLIKLQISFNNELANVNPETRKLSELGSAISKIGDKIDRLFNEMNRFEVSNTKYLELYAEFKVEIMYDVAGGREIFEKIELIAKNNIRYREYQTDEIKTINEDTSYLIVSVSANPDSFGKILGVGSQIRSLFEYKAAEVEEENVRILMPKVIGNVHDGFIARYFDTGVARIMGSSREVFGLTKSGYILYLELFLTVLPLLENVGCF